MNTNEDWLDENDMSFAVECKDTPDSNWMCVKDGTTLKEAQDYIVGILDGKEDSDYPRYRVMKVIEGGKVLMYIRNHKGSR